MYSRKFLFNSPIVWERVKEKAKAGDKKAKVAYRICQVLWIFIGMILLLMFFNSKFI